MAGSYVVFFAEPGRLEEGVAGVMEGEPVTMGWAYVYAAMVGLPLALAAGALFLRARTIAISNLVVGVPLGAFGLFAIVTHLAEGALHPRCDASCACRSDRVAHRGPQHRPTAPALTRGDRAGVGQGRLHGSGSLTSSYRPLLRGHPRQAALQE